MVFFSPEGDAFDSPAEVLAAVGVDASAVGPAAANENGGGGLGNETLADFQTNVAGSSPGSGPRLPGPVALGRVAPAPRAAGFALAGARGTHGGSGVRLARPEEAGLDAATDLLRAALWPKRNDASVGTEPVRRRLEAAAAGAPRSPFRLASDPLAVDASTERDRRGKGDARSPGGGGEGSPARSPGGGGGGASGCSRAFVSPPLTPTNLRQWWSPPRSPFGLLEEILWEDEWKLLVACMMLNCTTRLQVDRVLWRLFTLIPTPEEAVRLGREGGGEEATEDPFRDEDAAKSGLDRIEDILAPLGLHRKRARAFVRLSEEYLAARPNQALPAPDAPAGDDRDASRANRRIRRRRRGRRRLPDADARAASNAGGVAARSRGVRERRACHVLRGTDGGGAEGPRASVVVRVGGGTEGERQEGSREKKGEYRLAEGRATHGRRTRGRRVCVFSRHGVWCLSGVRRGGRVGIDSRRAISPRMIGLEFMCLAHPAWLKPPIVIRQSVESPARWLNLPVSPRRPRTHLARADGARFRRASASSFARIETSTSSARAWTSRGANPR